jgi:hypothetical protein
VRIAVSSIPLGFVLAGCLAVLDFDGVTGGDLTDAGDASSDAAPRTDAALRDVSSSDAPDGGSLDAAFDAPPICNGLTMLMRFDGTLTTAQGDTPSPLINAAYSAGKYGQAMALTTGTSVINYAGTNAAGKTDVLPREGTISAWVAARNWQLPCPVDDPDHPSIDFWYLDENGPGVDCYYDPDTNANYIENAFWIDRSSAAFAQMPIAPAPWNEGGTFNHVVATWSQSPTQLLVTVNGHAASSATPWTAPPAVGVLKLGSSTYPGSIVYDDLAVWTRALSASEISDIFASSTSLGEVCGLP